MEIDESQADFRDTPEKHDLSVSPTMNLASKSTSADQGITGNVSNSITRSNTEILMHQPTVSETNFLFKPNPFGYSSLVKQNVFVLFCEMLSLFFSKSQKF